MDKVRPDSNLHLVELIFLSNLVQWEVPLPTAGGLEVGDL